MLKSARIAVFVSGGGTNLQALLDAQRDGKIPHGEIALVISSQACAYALERAEKANVPAHTVPSSLIQHDFEAAIELLLEQYKIDVIVLAGFLSILSENFTKKWPRRILNIHPSLIPSFCGRGMYGLKVHEAALARGVKVTGATVHFVNEIPDGGEIIAQKAVAVEPGDTPEVLQRRVMDELGIDEVPDMSVSATAHSSILTLKVRDTDPQRAYDVMSAVIACYPEVAEFVVGSTVLVLLDESGMPTAPVAEFNYRYHITCGAVVGAAVWCVILAFLVLMKNTVHNEDELRETLNAPCLGQIPAVKISRKRPYPLLHRCESGFSESVRLLRLRVEKAMQENGQKILLVSSAIPGEGKTTVSVNLAVSLAQKGRRVLLIDCDFRNPSVAKTLSSKSHPLDEGRNLTNFTGSGEAAGALAQATDVEGLFVIVGNADGKADYFDAPTQARLTKLIRYARDKYDYVILDTPPCSLLTDAAEAAEAAEAGLMVIRQDYASRDQILDGAQRLSDSRLPIIGCALNNVRKSLREQGIWVWLWIRLWVRLRLWLRKQVQAGKEIGKAGAN